MSVWIHSPYVASSARERHHTHTCNFYLAFFHTIFCSLFSRVNMDAELAKT